MRPVLILVDGARVAAARAEHGHVDAPAAHQAGFSEGSENAPGTQFDDLLTEAGGWNNAYTSEDETAYHMLVPSGALDLALFLESDRMAFLLPALTQENLSNQQLVVLQERSTGYEAPHGRDDDALTRLQFPEGHPYHVPVIGTVADIEGFQLDGVRDFFERHYRPRNAVLALVGNFDTEEALARVEYWFGDVPDRGASDRSLPTPPAPRPATGLLADDVEDYTIYLSWDTVPLGHPDEPALDILAQVLSGGRGTRLDDRLYFDSSLAIDNSAYQWPSEVAGQFVIYATSTAPRLKKLRRVIDKELDRLRARPPAQEEVDRARRQLASGLLDGQESLTTRAESLADCQRLHGTPDCLVEDWKRYEAVTPEDVSRVAQAWLLPERRVELSVLPEAEVHATTPVIEVP